jgi:hypothetical protein
MRRAAVPIMLLALAFPIFSIAQATPRLVVANITFDFYVGKELMPAGTYNFDLDQKPGLVLLSNAKNNKSLLATVLTRISQTPGEDTRVVFDKMGDNYYLSELHAPGTDGYHFVGAPGPHSHVSVKAGK